MWCHELLSGGSRPQLIGGEDANSVTSVSGQIQSVRRDTNKRRADTSFSDAVRYVQEKTTRHPTSVWFPSADAPSFRVVSRDA